ncbi:Hypothetical protein NTJ_01036 [Nesidiocoris tenuis]|uniref:Uncharacterized protein n=1 Tax=Nesidiocoris tenuis TaxID=355587 RepID=A0ABN7ABL9_9HEMI|nr:Hypothetical protein NTJ_01036 [Nesidiocoris tenuis]
MICLASLKHSRVSPTLASPQLLGEPDVTRGEIVAGAEKTNWTQPTLARCVTLRRHLTGEGAHNKLELKSFRGMQANAGRRGRKLPNIIPTGVGNGSCTPDIKSTLTKLAD